jgi:hypothetical protein
MGVDRSQTVTATDHLISRYKSDGYEFVTIPQMLGAGPQVELRSRIVDGRGQ